MNVLIIPEDHTKDQYILKPLFERLFTTLGAPRTTVAICRNPRLQGVGEATDVVRLQAIVERYYPMYKYFILCVDRDGIASRKKKLDEIERALRGPYVFLAENAWEEIETWVLAGLDLLPGWRWSDIRPEVSVKEKYFHALARSQGVDGTPSGGRKKLGNDAARRIAAIRQKCPEDFGHLANRLQDALAAL